MAEEREQGLDAMAGEMAEDQKTLAEGLQAELKEDQDKAKGGGRPPKHPWWKVWARS